MAHVSLLALDPATRLTTRAGEPTDPWELTGPPLADLVVCGNDSPPGATVPLNNLRVRGRETVDLASGKSVQLLLLPRIEYPNRWRQGVTLTALILLLAATAMASPPSVIAMQGIKHPQGCHYSIPTAICPIAPLLGVSDGNGLDPLPQVIERSVLVVLHHHCGQRDEAFVRLPEDTTGLVPRPMSWRAAAIHQSRCKRGAFSLEGP